MISDSNDYYNQIAESWARVADPEPGLIRRFLAPSAGPCGSRALDVGCGAGHLLPSLLTRAGSMGKVVALDPAKRMLSIAKRKHPDAGIVFIDVPIESYDGGDGPFDLILFCRVLHHLSDPVKALNRVSRWLNPDGCVLVLHQSDVEHDRPSDHSHGNGAIDQIQSVMDDCALEAGARTVSDTWSAWLAVPRV